MHALLPACCFSSLVIKGLSSLMLALYQCLLSLQVALLSCLVIGCLLPLQIATLTVLSAAPHAVCACLCCLFVSVARAWLSRALVLDACSRLGHLFTLQVATLWALSLGACVRCKLPRLQFCLPHLMQCVLACVCSNLVGGEVSDTGNAHGAPAFREWYPTLGMLSALCFWLYRFCCVVLDAR